MAYINNGDDPSDQIEISTFGQRIELRIGWPDRGVTRFAKLRLGEARKVAAELIRQADELAERNKEKKRHADEMQALKDSGEWPF